MHPPNRRRPQHPVNRRRPRPSPARAAAHRRGLAIREQLRRVGVWLCALPRHLRDSLTTQPTAADSAAYGQIPQPWDRQPADPGFERRPTEPGYRPAADPDRERRDDHTAPRTAPYPALERPSIELGQRDDRPDLGRPAASSSAASGFERRPTEPATPRTAEIGYRIDPCRPSTADPGLGRRPTELAPHRTAAELGHRAAALGRQLAPRAAYVGRQLGTLGRTGALATGRGMRAAGRRLVELRPLLGLLRRFFIAVGTLTVRLLSGLGYLLAAVRDGLVRHRDVVFGLLTRAMWWGALALFLLGGRALVEIHGRAPLDQQALPAFAAGLGLCALLVLVAAQARLRWAALVLGFSHGGLLALVWVVAAAI